MDNRFSLCFLCVLCVFVVNPAFAAEPAGRRIAATPSAPATPTARPAPPNPPFCGCSQARSISSPRRRRPATASSSPASAPSTSPRSTASPSIPRPTRASHWTKTTPFLKLPTVSSPAVVGDKLIFGDGMHQTDGGARSIASASTRDGPTGNCRCRATLVHLEGSPTVVDGKVYRRRRLGRRALRGHEPRDAGRQGNGPAAIQKILDAKWAELQAKYEVDKKKDPTARRCRRARTSCRSRRPCWLWQQGKDKWHVDAPVDGGRRPRAGRRRPSSTRNNSATAPCSASTPRPATSSGGRR